MEGSPRPPGASEPERGPTPAPPRPVLADGPPAPPAPGGPGTTTGAGRRADDGRARVFPCGTCGADVEFDPRSQGLVCPFCGKATSVALDPARKVSEQDYAARVAWLKEVRAGRMRTQVEGVSEVRCEGCAAVVTFRGPLTSSECAFCGAPIQRDKVHDAPDRVPVDGVLPFAVEQTRAKELLRDWVRTRWFAPGEFRRRGVEGRFAGVYVPFWTFDAHTLNDYVGRRGEHYYTTRRVGNRTVSERHTRWYPASGRFGLFFDDVLVVAAKELPTALLRKLEPWPLARVRPYDPDLMAGFLAQTYEVELEPGFVEARARMEEEIRAETRRRIGGDEQQILSLDSVFDPIAYKHLLLPVWLLSYRYGETTHRIAVNAVTGEVQGTRPWSVWKIAGLVLAIAAAAAIALAVAGR